MAILPSMEEMAKTIAENALHNTLYKGKTLAEWINQIKAFRWISVEERMPKYNEDVLVFRPSMAMKIVVTRYNGYYGEDDEEWHEGWEFYGFDNKGRLVITHWMPMPEPPKEDA